MAVAKPALTREALEAEGLPADQPVKYAHENEGDRGKAVAKPAIERAGYQLQRVGGKKGKKHPPKMKQVLQQRSGVFLVEFYWRKRVDAEVASNWHVVAVNCDQRRVWCNALGVLPFTMMKAKETPATHAELLSHLHVLNVTRVWRVLRP